MIHYTVLFFLILQIYGQKVVEIELYVPTFFNLYIGQPRREITASLSLEITNTILLDDSCGVHPTNCPRYCNDEAFAAMYCEPACRFKDVTKDFACNSERKSDNEERQHFFLSDSKSFKLLNENTWNRRTWFTNTLSGKLFTDKLVFVVDDELSSTENLEIENAVLIDGSMLDEWLFYPHSNALVGFGPEEDNIVSQLYAQKLIPRPIVHFTMRMYYTGLLKIGDYGDDKHCVNWTEHANKHENRWVLEVDSLELNGVRYERKLKALITNHDNFISVPLDFMNTVIEAGIVKKLNETETVIEDVDYYIDCNQSLELQMTVDGRLFTILRHYGEVHNKEVCAPLINPIDLSRYNTDIDLILGWPFLNNLCVSFDFAEKIIRLAKQL